MKNTVLIICAIFALNISHIFVASQFTQNDNDAYDYYDGFEDGSTTIEPATDAPTTTTTTTTTTTPRTSYRRTTRPAGVVYYSKPFRFSSTNKYEAPRTRATTTQSSAGINRNAIDLERSENRKDYAQSRIAEDTDVETEEEKYLSRRYARFLFLQRVG